MIGMKKIYLSEPSFSGNEKKYLNKCITTGYVSSVGKYVNIFEEKIKQFTKSKHCIACINGTSALQLAVKLAGVNPGDEVIAPTMTFVATINAIKYNNASPVFMDCDEYFNIDQHKVIKFIKTNTYYSKGFTYNKKSKKKIKAIIVAHIWGNLSNISELFKLCKKKGIFIIEDAAESLGSIYGDKKKQKHTGTIGDIGVISFNGNKLITSGCGGAILTQNKNIAIKAKYLSNQARENNYDYIHDDVGYNFRLSNLNAAVGVAQLEKINIKLKKKKFINKYYKQKIKNKFLFISNSPDYGQNNFWINILRFNSKKISRKKLIKKFNEKKIEVRPIWYPIHLLKPYKKYQKFEITKSIEFLKTSICLPSSTSLTNKDLNRIIKVINNI